MECCKCTSMTPQRQKSTTIVTSFIFFLLGGIEYAVILPTLNDYVLEFSAPSFYLGLTLSAFSLSGLLVAPFFGVIHDKVRKTKGMLLFANCFEIGGNLLYFFAESLSPNILVASRFIAGIGAGVGASMLAQIARTTTEKERSAAFALFMAARQFGLIFGPALNLMFIALDTHIGPYKLNKLTAPGLFMAVVWSLFQLLVIFLYYDLPFLADLVPSNTLEVEGSPDHNYDEVMDSGEVHHGTPGNIQNGYGAVRPNPYEEEERKHPAAVLTMKQKIMALLQEEIVVMLAATFIFFFNQTALETCLTPMTKNFLGLDSLGNSLLYCMAGVEIIVGFILIKFLSERIQDRVVITIGLLIEIVSLTFLCIFLPMTLQELHPEDDWTNWAWLISVFVVQVFGLPFIMVANISLLSKLVPEEIQGFSQGVRRSIMGIGTIMGPLWATGILEIPIAFGVVMVILFSLVQTMVFLSWGKLAEPKREDLSNQPRLLSGTTGIHEGSPLLDDPEV